MQIAIVTGLSGAGRSTAAKCLEDLGWFVVDNLPPGLLATMADLGTRSQGAVSRIAAVVDIRGRAFFPDLRASLDALAARGVRPRVLYLEASTEVLVRRFESVRRPHPLQEDDLGGAVRTSLGTSMGVAALAHGETADRIVDAINEERALLRDLRGEADLVLDTTSLNVHELRASIDAAFGTPEMTRLRATVLSFGFKYGLPADADLVADCRFLPNPHWVDELRAHTGLDTGVRDYVLSSPGAADFLRQYGALLRTIEAGYAREGKRWLTLAVGCTGGKHRSVAMAEALGGVLAADDLDVRVVHRDLGRE